MKLTAICLLGFLIQASATGNAQTVTISAKEASLKTIFKAIEKQTGFVFFYNIKDLSEAKPVTVLLKNASLEDALKVCLKDQPLNYLIKDNTIFITAKAGKTGRAPGEDPMEAAKNLPPPVDVSGRVVDQDGKPLPGATVKVKGTARGANTNADGYFELNNVDENATLEISFVEHETVTVKLNSRSSLVITLQPSKAALNEVVVNKGYYSERQRLSTGNVSQVKAQEIERQPVLNPLQALQGRVPGLNITQETGIPGAGFKVEIRGTNSIANGNNPLYIIDGVPVNSSVVYKGSGVAAGTSLSSTVPSTLNYINPLDIESVEVLKDADATAIYGSRAANGVILITTKKGKSGRTNVSVNLNRGIGQVGHFMDLMNKEQYLEYRRITFQTSGATPGPQDYEMNGTWDDNPYTDWQETLIGGNAQYTDAQVSVSGGSATTQFMLSGGYHKETTVYPRDYYNRRYSVQFSLTNISLNKKLRMQFSGNYSAVNGFLPYVDMATRASYYPVTPKPFNEDGSLNWENSTWLNPYAFFEVRSTSRSDNLVGNVRLSYQLLPGLMIETNAGYTRLHYDDILAMPSTYRMPSTNITDGRSTFGYNNYSTWNIEPQLSYNAKLLGGKIDMLLGATVLATNAENSYITAQGYTDNSLLESMAGAASIAKGNHFNNEYEFNSLFARLNYNYRDKYIINLTGRRDGSSRFGPNNKFGNFGAAGVAWIFSNESFFSRALPFINYGKLRSSYGVTGNDQIADYRFIDLYAFTNWIAQYQGTQGIFPENLFNPDLGWEINKKLEVSLEGGLWNDRVNFSAAWYRNRSGNQLVTYPLPDITGFTSIPYNLPAVVQNRGWEFMLGGTIFNKKGFRWRSSFNITFPQNKLLSFPDIKLSTYAFTKVVGKSVNSLPQFDYVGVDPQSGLFVFRDIFGNITHMVNSTRDRYLASDPDPDFYGGFQNSFSWKGFELDVMIHFVQRLNTNPLVFGRGVQPGRFQRFDPRNWHVDVLQAWQKPGDITHVQRLSPLIGTEFNTFTNVINSRYAWVDASFARIKNLSLSYQAPKRFQELMHLQSARIYVQCQNLFTFTSYKGFDPENDGESLPPLRVITAGIQLTL